MCLMAPRRMFVEKPAYQKGSLAQDEAKIIQSNCLKLLHCKSNQGQSRTKRFNCQEDTRAASPDHMITYGYHVFATGYTGKIM